MRSIISLLFTSCLVACGGGSSSESADTNNSTIVPPPVSTAKVIGDIEFEDEFIKNCVMMFKASISLVTGELELTHGLVDSDGVWHEDYRDTDVNAVKSLSGCSGYNSFNELEMATTLADLRHFPNLKSINLDFDSSDWHTLEQITQIESAYIVNSNLSDYSIVTRLPNLKRLQVSPELADWSFLQFAENLEGFTTPYTEQGAFTGFQYLTASLMGLHSQGAMIDTLALYELSRFTNLQGLSLEFGQYDNALDLSSLYEFQQLSRFSLYNKAVEDLSFLNSSSIQSLRLVISPDFDVNQFENFTKLRDIYIHVDQNAKGIGAFNLEYRDSSVRGFHISKPNDSTYAEVILYDTLPSELEGRMKVANDGPNGHYLLYDIPQSEFVYLLTLWQEGNLEFR